MRNATMQDLLATLNKIEDQALQIRFHSEETYNKFNSEIIRLRQQLVNIEDDNYHMTSEDFDIVRDITLLEAQMNTYMNSGKTEEDLSLSFGEDSFSGNENDKQVRIHTYKTLALYIGNMQTVDIERLRLLKEQWESEKDNHNYSVAELNEIEIALANAFIDYQIKTCASEGNVPKEAKEDFCVPEVYEREFKKRVFDYVATLPKGTPERLNLETYCFNWNLDDALRCKAIWKGLSGREPDIIQESKREIKNPEPVEEPQKPEEAKEEKDNILPLNLNEKARGNSVMVVYEKKLPDGTLKHKRKIVPLGENGGFKLFFNKDKVVELYFLEGTENLFYSKNGATTPSYNHLSEFPNLRNVYLPASLRTIEQGYFYNCDNLENVFVAEGTFYNPNRQLFPDGTKIVHSEKRVEGPAIIIEPDEKAAIFTRELSDGQNRTVKVPLEDGRHLPESFVKKGYSGLKEVRYTEGTKIVGIEYWTQEYEPEHVKGGLYTGIKGLKKVVLPESLELLDNRTFWGCQYLEEVVLPSRLREIRPFTFASCPKLKTVTLPDELKVIGPNAFQLSTALKSLEFPDSLEEIYYDAFFGCERLETVTFPDGMKKIGNGAFTGCCRLSNLKLPSRKIKEIAMHSFKDCGNLKTVCFPAEIDNFWGDSFRNCINLESVVLPINFSGTVNPFSNCKKLHYVLATGPVTDEKLKELFSDSKELVILRSHGIPEDMTPEELLEQKINEKKAEEAKKIADYLEKKEEVRQQFQGNNEEALGKE